ncbi:MAG: hypothetical protein OEZ32_01145 [Nitrospinota bacterium]|nr:hypothetical protein [Nitrospinota bacterium]
MELFRVYTVRENYQDRDSVVVDWFCENRKAPVAALELMVENLVDLTAVEKTEAQTRLNQLLTSGETDELAQYIRATTGFEVKRTRIDIPLPDGRKVPDFSGKSASMEGEYFHIHENSEYNLSIPITGFVDLSEPPNTFSVA